MQKIGFDNQKYIETQSSRIRERIGQFGGKLYLEFGGKLFDDYHASRVLPGFAPDSKIRMLQQLRDDVEIVVAICAGDIEKNKVRGDLGIPYEEDVLRLIDVFRGMDLYVGSVVVTQYSGQPAADAFLGQIPHREGLKLGIARRLPPAVLVVELAEAGCHLAAAGAGGGDHHQGAAGLDVVVASVALLADIRSC